MTHEAGHSCPVGNKTQSETVGQSWRGENEHIAIFKHRAPLKTSESLAISTLCGSMGKLHKESA